MALPFSGVKCQFHILVTHFQSSIILQKKKKGARNVLMKLFYLQMRCLIFAAILTVALATFGKEQ